MDLNTVGSELETKSVQEVLTWASKNYPGKVSIACSFSAEDCVLAAIASKENLDMRVFAIDTGRLNEETYQTAERLRDRFGTKIDWFHPQTKSVEMLIRNEGLYSFYQSIEKRHDCCGIRKVEPLNRALSELSAWVTGLRREQSLTRTTLKVIERDDNHNGIIKLNPLAGWTSVDVMEFAKKEGVPLNTLYKKGYQSIGCAPCTRAVATGEHERSGRWWWEDPENKECGLHVSQDKK